MKKNRMPLENKMIFYVILVIAVLNIIAYVSVKDWNSIVFFCLAGFIGHAFKLGNTLSLIIAILSANIFRATNMMREGLKNKHNKHKHHKKHHKKHDPKTDNKNENKEEPVPNEKSTEGYASISESSHSLEGLANSANKLMDRQKSLQLMTKKLEPMMQQAMQLMDKLPKGFLENAMKK